MTPDFPELRELLDALCEESITAEQMVRLEAILLADPAAEAFYVQYMSMFADLQRHFGGQAAPERLRRRLVEQASERGPRLISRGWSWCRRNPAKAATFLGIGASLAASILVVLQLLQFAPQQPPTVPPPDEATDNSVAVLSQGVGAEWEATGMPTTAGTPLPPGRLRLKAGVARIEFYSGATVILEGPAELELISADKARCTRGKLHARVPPQAAGFTVETPRLQVVDRGTEFGLNIADRTEVHVFKGKVELHEGAAGPRELKEGQALSYGTGPGDPLAANVRGFVSAEQLAERIKGESQRRQEAWLATSQRLRNDPGLLVYYSFEDDAAWNGTLRNQALTFPGNRDGAVVGCQWTEGRWPGKRALEFKRVGDRVRFHVPGTYESMSLLAWVRVDGLDRTWNSLMLTDNFEEGALHWQIDRNGALILGVQGPKKKNGVNYASPVIFRPERMGQWVQLAVVFDRAAGRVTHYVDGQQVSRDPLKPDVVPHIGNAEIGNWNPAGNGDTRPLRNFNGRIDEFLMFARPLTDQEIQELYTQGKPRS